jgi:hypothetical protein
VSRNRRRPNRKNRLPQPAVPEDGRKENPIVLQVGLCHPDGDGARLTPCDVVVNPHTNHYEERVSSFGISNGKQRTKHGRTRGSCVHQAINSRVKLYLYKLNDISIKRGKYYSHVSASYLSTTYLTLHKYYKVVFYACRSLGAMDARTLTVGYVIADCSHLSRLAAGWLARSSDCSACQTAHWWG